MAKIYIRWNEQDTEEDSIPNIDLFNLVSSWGGFLSILLAVGMPAVMLNRIIFLQTVKQLIAQEKITYDDELRTLRAKAVSGNALASISLAKSLAQATRENSVRTARVADDGSMAAQSARPVAEAVEGQHEGHQSNKGGSFFQRSFASFARTPSIVRGGSLKSTSLKRALSAEMSTRLSLFIMMVILLLITMSKVDFWMWCVMLHPSATHSFIYERR